jgi:diguanylate cyclase (GGDEF)-like protein
MRATELHNEIPKLIVFKAAVMKNFSLKAQIYIILTLAAGSFFIIYSLIQPNLAVTWLETIILSVIASLALLFKVEGATNRTHYNISFLVYGFTLVFLGAPQATIVILISHLVELAYHKYPWYIQTFNLSMYILVANASGLVLQMGNPTGQMDTWMSALSILVSMAVFTLANHLMVGVIVWLARGENFAKSGIFNFFPLLVDMILLCMGCGAAVIWFYNPLNTILVLMPLYLIYATLRVPALERQSETDPKTGVFNHKYFEKNLESELRRADRFDNPLTVVMADLDLLRNVNNTYGHLAGDEVLIGVANVMKVSVRDYDVVARFGGEEFAIILPQTTAEKAYTLIEKIRIAIAEKEFIVPTSVTPIHATMSFGIASRENGITAKEIVNNADTALYHSKLKGRNRTYIYSNEGIDNLFQLPTEKPINTPACEEVQALVSTAVVLPALVVAPAERQDRFPTKA